MLGAPAWLVASLLLLTATVATAAVRRRREQRQSTVLVTAQDRASLPLTDAHGPLPDQAPSKRGGLGPIVTRLGLLHALGRTGVMVAAIVVTFLHLLARTVAVLLAVASTERQVLASTS